MIRNALVNAGKAAAIGMVAVTTSDISLTDKASSSSSVFLSNGSSSSSAVTTKVDPTYTQIDLSKYPSLEHHMLHSSFRGDGKLEDYRIFLNDKASSLIAISRFGNKACGHPTTIHGGALAAILDDTMGSLFLASRIGHGYTANLNIDYRKPVTAGTNLRVQADLERIETARSGSKKVYIKAIITNEDQSCLYTEAKGLFITKPKPSEAAGMLETKSSDTKMEEGNDSNDTVEAGNPDDTITPLTSISGSRSSSRSEEPSQQPEKMARFESR